MYDLITLHNDLALTGVAFLDRLNQLEAKLISLVPNDAKLDPPLKHYFEPNRYTREMYLNAGDTIIGKTHRHAHLCRVISGKALVFSEYGWAEISAPFEFVAPKGIKRLFVALEDFVFQTVHETHLTDLEQIERELIVQPDDVRQYRIENKLEISL
ncbi:hypothetical protein [Acinetobacter ursingii]|uniref:hypothetical protein n=1 Tax=Acinetobacter ursingii TaxID=108980 RepID=UPI0012508D24|nr:hypothetical protein [Acinetobacter ursingii]